MSIAVGIAVALVVAFAGARVDRRWTIPVVVFACLVGYGAKVISENVLYW